MNDSTRRSALLAVGLLLVTSPLYAPALDVTGQDYEYRSTRVVAEENRIRVVNGSELPYFAGGVEGIDCLLDHPISRLCVHDAELLNGTRRADHPAILDVAGNPQLRADAKYVAFTNDAPVYVRTADWRNGEYVVGLERVSARKALEDVAVAPGSVSPQVRTVVEEGSVRTDEPLSDANRVVETEDGYFFVYQQGHSARLEANPQRERLLEWLAVLLGAVLLRRA